MVDEVKDAPASESKPDFKTLDLVAVLAGINYPTEEVPIYLDQNLGYLINKTNAKLQDLADAGNTEAYDELEKTFLEMLKSAESVKYIVTLEGVPLDTVRNLLEATFREYPQKYDAFGREQPNLVANEAYATRLWAAHIRKIVGPDGSVREGLLSEEEASAFRSKIPDHARNAIDAAVQELSDGAKAGFELAAKEQVFLSTP